MMTLTARISDYGTTTYTESVHQHDRNVTVIFEGIDLPEKYEVHFANQKERGISVACVGSATGVKIPDPLLSTGDYVYGWVCIVDDDTGCEARYEIVIPVIPRPVPIPIQTSTEDIPIITNYDLNADEENLSFTGYFNGIIDQNKEEAED